ncbi:hypothetical protein ACFSC4_24455 [Deinococcus malanensis]|uniref:hypothetical protein n=1 Tax=Deinococcus malanensis TaxID=1706855 RepID=UPI00363855D7
MKRLLLRLREYTRRFWFIPTVMTVVSLLLAHQGISLEERWGCPTGWNLFTEEERQVRAAS